MPTISIEPDYGLLELLTAAPSILVFHRTIEGIDKSVDMVPPIVKVLPAFRRGLLQTRPKDGIADQTIHLLALLARLERRKIDCGIATNFTVDPCIRRNDRHSHT